jgi:hypothetical protein
VSWRPARKESAETDIITLAVLIFPAFCSATEYKGTPITGGDTITVTQSGFKTTTRMFGTELIDTAEPSVWFI